MRLGYEFNIACRAFTAIGVETADLGPVPDLLRAILEDTLSQDACPASLDRFLPRIRDIIISLLHGLKRKQQRLRARHAKENQGGSSSQATRQLSVGSTGSGDTGISHMLEDGPSNKNTGKISERRVGSGNSFGDEFGVPPRTSSASNGIASPLREETGFNAAEKTSHDLGHDGERHLPSSLSDSSLSSTTMQDLPILSPEEYKLPIQRMSVQSSGQILTPPTPPPPPPPKQQDALAALQRGGDLERRASRRYSAYQISKHLGAPPGGVPMLPPSQNSPIPNRGRDVRESLNAVRTRGSHLPVRQRSPNRFGDPSPTRGNPVPRRISEESSQTGNVPTIIAPPEQQGDHSPTIKTPEDKYAPTYLDLNGTDRPALSATMNGPPTNEVDGLTRYDLSDVEDTEPQKVDRSKMLQRQLSTVSIREHQGPIPSSIQGQHFVPEQSPQPGKELTLFLQYKSKIKKYVLPDGLSDLSIARLQLAFIEKFAWNTHSNGIDLPEIYIQDPVSGVRHELEDLSDVKDRSVLVLNVEVLDEVKRHIDEGLGGLRRMVEGVRTVVDGQQAVISQVSDRQQDTAKSIARLATVPTPVVSRAPSFGKPQANGVRSFVSSNQSSNQASSIQSLRRDLAVVRQTFSSYTSELTNSMDSIRAKASSLKSTAVDTVTPTLDATSGRAHVYSGKKTVGEQSETIVNRVDDLQDLVEDLRKDVVSRGVRPLPRQLETVSKEISLATAELKKMQEYLTREKPVWTKVWEKELEQVCNDREFLTMQEDLVADLEDDLEKATQTFALVEEATKQQNLQAAQTPGGTTALRSTSRGMIASDTDVDPVKAKDGVLGEVRALQPNHETRLEAIERAEKARQKELESRREGEFKKELGNFVDEGKLRKSGGVEEAERLRKAKDERIRREGWEKQQARSAAKGKEAEDRSMGPEPAVQFSEEDGGRTASPEPNFTEAPEEQVNETGGEKALDAGEVF